MSTEGISNKASIRGLENVRSFPIKSSTIAKITVVVLAALVFVTAGSLLYHYGHLLSPQVFYSMDTQIISSGIIGLIGIAGGISSTTLLVQTDMPNRPQLARRRNLLEAIEKQKNVAGLKDVDLSLHPVSISCQVRESHAKGPRRSMQDKTLIVEDDWSLLAAIFDGHGDSLAAKHANSRFAELFAHFRTTHEISRAFEKTMLSIHRELFEVKEQFKRAYLANLEKYSNSEKACEKTIKQNPALVKKLTCGGTTACACYIDKETGRVYTATLGDTEARDYRKVDDTIYSIPLSPVKNWSDPDEARRAKTLQYFADDFSITLSAKEVKKHRQHLDVKELRDPSGILNVSGAIGDLDQPALNKTPICTEHQLEPGDRLVLACDGLWDCIPSEKKFIDDVMKPKWASARMLASTIKTKALTQYRTSDNISVVVIFVGDQK